MVSQQWEKVMSADLGAIPTARAFAVPVSIAIALAGCSEHRQVCVNVKSGEVVQAWDDGGFWKEAIDSRGFKFRLLNTSQEWRCRSAIATEARRAETTGSVHEGAGRKASPKPNNIGETNDR